MKKHVWILNHYATNSYFNNGGRHYWFSRNLIKEGYKPLVFCADRRHNSIDAVKIDHGKYYESVNHDIPYVFIKTTASKKSKLSRVMNMISFYKNILAMYKKYAKENGKPDIIIASSVHPLTLAAGIQIAKYFNIECICEIRDLWPESIVAYNLLSRKSIIARILYAGEKLLYKKANKLIFTFEGGADYIKDQKWDISQGGPIELNKVYYLNNGVDLDAFNYNKKLETLYDQDLENDNFFKVIYTGSIRKVNEVGYIVEVAKEVQSLGMNDVKFIIYGEGDEKANLIKKVEKEKIKNIVFKGRVAKNKIPFVLSHSDVNILHFKDNSIKKYGASLNKLFEYFASARPIISDCEFGYDLIKKYDCGVVIDKATPEQLAREILKIKNLDEKDYNLMCNNSSKLARLYDFKKLTKGLITIIEEEK